MPDLFSVPKSFLSAKGTLRLPFLLLTLLSLLGCTTASEQKQPTVAELYQAKALLEKTLQENILPFWYPHILDREHGGYHLNHDHRGRWMGPADKYLVTQARTIWFFSRLAQSGYGTAAHLAAAKQGYEFLRDKMWDPEWGGFFWAVNTMGEVATMPYKHLYGQAFGLYALSEYALASREAEVKALAQELFRTLDSRAHDSQYGGYKESFLRNWQPVPEGAQTYMGTSSSLKLMNTHLHLMEALTAYYRATQDSLARERLIELIMIQSSTVVRSGVGACTDQYQLDWTPLKDNKHARVSYGHDLENVWLLLDACKAAGIPEHLYLDLCRALFRYSIQYGFDSEDGGFYDSGAINHDADRRQKTWWVQAEAMVSVLWMYRLTRQPEYLRCFRQTLGWITNYQTDWEWGDWHATIAEDGSAHGAKAGPWKSPYHNGRAVIVCLTLVAELLENWAH